MPHNAPLSRFAPRRWIAITALLFHAEPLPKGCPNDFRAVHSGSLDLFIQCIPDRWR
jgi:hypothetical protein